MRVSVQHCIEEGLPFALYRKPGGIPRLLVQTQGTPHPFLPGAPFPLENGYLLIPFHPSQEDPAYMLSPDLLLHEDRPERIPGEGAPQKGSMPCPPIQADDRASYEGKVDALVRRIQEEKALQKVVLSRSERVHRKAGSSVGALFEALEALYPDAFVHLFHLPEKATWIGATPELLLEMKGEEGRTQALAGTRPKGEGMEWSDKERREQASVEEHISTVLEQNEVPFERSGPETVSAGNIEHLSTHFSFSAQELGKAPSKLIRELHPTPAVCGSPRDRAMELIEATESRSRSFYAGAIGPWGVEGEYALYVNLRSARIWEEALELFVGGGINSGSDPEKEWEETVRKAGTVRRALGD